LATTNIKDFKLILSIKVALVSPINLAEFKSLQEPNLVMPNMSLEPIIKKWVAIVMVLPSMLEVMMDGDCSLNLN